MSALDDLHPSDRDRLRRLAEMLFDISAARLASRAPLIDLTTALVVTLRRGCAAMSEATLVSTIEEAADRLLGIADDWAGVDTLMDAALAVIVGAPMPPPPAWLEGRQRAADAILGPLQ